MTQVLPVLFDGPDHPLAILRCATSVAQTGSTPHADVSAAAREALPLLDSSAPALVRAELERMCDQLLTNPLIEPYEIEVAP